MFKQLSSRCSKIKKNKKILKLSINLVNLCSEEKSIITDPFIQLKIVGKTSFFFALSTALPTQ